MNKILTISLLIQLLLVACFIWFGWQADQAMDRTGIGDLHEWKRLNGLVGMAFYGAAVVWLVTIVLSFVGRAFGSIRAQLAIGFPPFALALGWCALWLI